MFELIGFDGDDTLWHSEDYYQAAHAEFERIVARYIDLENARVHERLLEVEQGNIQLFGYGAKGMTLSMVEAAIALTHERISATDIHRIVRIGKEVLAHPVELLPGICDAVGDIAARYPVVLITKGDLFHQESKIAACGLAEQFPRIEIVSEKDEAAYARVLRECGVAPEHFVMVGNSLRSDIAPVLALGGWGVHVPYHLTWAHEMDANVADDEPRLARVRDAREIPAAIERLAQEMGRRI